MATTRKNKGEPVLNAVARRLGRAAGALTNATNELRESLAGVPATVAARIDSVKKSSKTRQRRAAPKKRTAAAKKSRSSSPAQKKAGATKKKSGGPKRKVAPRGKSPRRSQSRRT